ncbi:polyphosphate--glucose phosphotransferase [Spelaeicoccus albus]|uniref:polyphosphate--glucose phosphotransferase n=1 Tax=Spelaeicoccus albus TaxID=1280376 RepID=UPI0015CDF646|nr:ROK family protein [Spelaeicoccus albus]
MSKKHHLAVGVDIGGSGIKGALVNLHKGKLVKKRTRIPTPRPADPEAVVDVVADVVRSVAEHAADHDVIESPDEITDLPLGVTFPGIMKSGVAHSAANLGDHWVGLDVAGMISQATGRTATVLNDADAAGQAEIDFGAGKDTKGVVLMTTLGTGIGCALFLNGKLVPNVELGHIEIDGHDAETRAAESARDREGLDWRQWADRLQRYYSTLEFLFSPDLFIVGGGVSKRSEEFLPLLNLDTPIVPAGLLNEAGIIGAAAMAGHAAKKRRKNSAGHG